MVCVCDDSGDVIGALEASMECQKQYNQMPRIHDVICRLVEKGETEPLQKGDTHARTKRLYCPSLGLLKRKDFFHHQSFFSLDALLLIQIQNRLRTFTCNQITC